MPAPVSLSRQNVALKCNCFSSIRIHGARSLRTYRRVYRGILRDGFQSLNLVVEWAGNVFESRAAMDKRVGI